MTSERRDRGYWSGKLERTKDRLAELEERGIAALSRYDVEVAHQGDAEQALQTAKWLLGDQVGYFTGRLAELGPELPRQATLFELPIDAETPGKRPT